MCFFVPWKCFCMFGCYWLYWHLRLFWHHDGFVIVSHWYSTHGYGMLSTIWYPKKTFFADFPCILPICDYYHACFGGCLAETLLSKCYSCHRCGFFCFPSQPLSSGGRGWGVMLLSNNTFTTSYLFFGFRGNLNRVWLLELYSPVAWWKPTTHSYSHSFLDMEQAKFKFASCAVGRSVHCWMLMEAAEFSFREVKKKVDLLSTRKKTLNSQHMVVKATIGCLVLHLKKQTTNLLIASVTSSHL